jgi:hypothetical protein
VVNEKEEKEYGKDLEERSISIYIYDVNHKTDTDKRNNGNSFNKINKLQYMSSKYHIA